MSGDPAPVSYMQRTRAYYLALGYDNPYQWARHEDAPFAPLRQPLTETRLALVTTAAPFQPDKGDQGPGAPYNAAAKFYAVYSGDTARDHDLRIAHVGIDRKHTSMEDSGCWFPLPAMRRFSSPTVPFVTKASRLPRGISKQMASPQSFWAARAISSSIAGSCAFCSAISPWETPPAGRTTQSRKNKRSF